MELSKHKQAAFSNKSEERRGELWKDYLYLREELKRLSLLIIFPEITQNMFTSIRSEYLKEWEERADLQLIQFFDRSEELIESMFKLKEDIKAFLLPKTFEGQYIKSSDGEVAEFQKNREFDPFMPDEMVKLEEEFFYTYIEINLYKVCYAFKDRKNNLIVFVGNDEISFKFDDIGKYLKIDLSKEYSEYLNIV